MNCIYCNQHLYKRITLKALFQYPYRMHDKCESKIQLSTEDVIPFSDHLIQLHYLFETEEDSDQNALFHHYGKHFFYGYFKSESDLLLMLDDSLENLLVTRYIELVVRLSKGFIYLALLYRDRII